MSSGGGGFTAIILWVATGAVALSVSVMIISLAIMTGFKQEITRKMFGFWGHIHISDPRSIRSYEALPFDFDTALIESIAAIETVETSQEDVQDGVKHQISHGGVRHVHAYIYLPGILTHDGEMEGIILKGVGKDFDWDNINLYNTTSEHWTSIAPE